MPRYRFDIDDFFNTDFNIKTPLNILEDDENFYIKINIPGVEKEDIKIEYKENYVIISGEKKMKEVKNKIYEEISSGKFSRSIYMKNIKFDKAEATYEKGELNIQIPKEKDKSIKSLKIS